MSDLKFSCPSCAQHIQCDESYAGERIPCPNCATLVRVPVDAPLAPTKPVAEDIPQAPPGPGAAAVPTLEENFSKGSETPLPTTPPMTEREKQIAAARAERPVVPAPVVKPRLSYILSGGQAPVAEENESAAHTEPKHPEHPEEAPHEKTLHE